MTYFQSFILGIVQGFSEFLPISSSGHLVVVPYLLGWELRSDYLFPFFILIQVASLLAVFVYFWDTLIDIIKAFIGGLISRKPFDDRNSRLGWYLIFATIPAALAGLFLKDLIENSFSIPWHSGIFLIVTSLILLVAERIGQKIRTINEMTWKDSIWIGFCQVLALFPGISRSGSTIAGGTIRGFKRQDSARFAFLMSIPVMLGAGIIAINDLLTITNISKDIFIFLPGIISSAISSYFAIGWLLGLLNRKSLNPFALYCFLMGVLVLGFTGYHHYF